MSATFFNTQYGLLLGEKHWALQGLVEGKRPSKASIISSAQLLMGYRGVVDSPRQQSLVTLHWGGPNGGIYIDVPKASDEVLLFTYGDGGGYTNLHLATFVMNAR